MSAASNYGSTTPSARCPSSGGSPPFQQARGIYEKIAAVIPKQGGYQQQQAITPSSERLCSIGTSCHY